LNTSQSRFENLQKGRRGLKRLWHATGHSIAGLQEGWKEPAFRLEVFGALVALPLAIWLGRSWVETVLLFGTVLMVLVVELLNTAVEAAIDRVGLDWHALSRRAKDLGSAAVLLSLLLCGVTWGCALFVRFTEG
jgi:diacylglycerol kinase (ATP)